MKVLRLVWDHPGLAVLLAVVLWSLAPIALAHPLLALSSSSILALSMWAGWRRADEIGQLEKAVDDARVAHIRNQFEAAQSISAAWRMGGRG